MSTCELAQWVRMRCPGPHGMGLVLPLALPEWQYVVWRIGPLWHVAVRATGELIYCGAGPVEIVGPPAPF